MLMKCPHCQNKVLVGSDNKCPACKKNINEIDNVDTDIEKITVFENDELPNKCFHCGIKTDRKIRFDLDKKTNDHGAGSVFFIIFGWLFYLIYKLLKVKNHTYIYVPVCHECDSKNQVKPEYINHENFSIDIMVCKEFYKEFCNQKNV